MVEFLTKTGVFLDLASDFDFEITIENPLLRDDRVPVPFSTNIAFLPTVRNRMVFGYLGALMLEPSVKSIEVDIMINGVTFFSGVLEYDSVDTSGNLNYTFAGRNVTDAWATEKIWQISDIEEEYISYPLVVNELMAASPGFKVIEDGYRPRTEDNVNYKYRNFPDNLSVQAAMPAVAVSALLGDNLDFDSGNRLSERILSLVVFGTYAAPNVVECLPDISRLDLLINICRMFCAALFQDGSRYRLISADSILSASDAVDWDSKISDIYSLSREIKQNYELRFRNSEDYAAQAMFADVDSLSAVLGNAGLDDYFSICHTGINDYYSAKSIEIPIIGITGHFSEGYVYGRVGKYSEYIIERLNSVSGTQRVSDMAAEMHTVEIAFIPAKSAPVGWDKYLDERFDGLSPAISSYVRRMASFVKFPAPDAERPSEVYIAISGNAQVCDKSVVFSQTDSPNIVPDMQLDELLSLDSRILFELYHAPFASWLATDRQIILADVNLSAQEISSFRMWQKVLVRGRQFLVSKLMVRISSKSGGISSSCELIGL